MQLKYTLTGLILAIFLGLLASQANFVGLKQAQAQEGPATTPITYFLLSGRVGYYSNGTLSPAANVRVHVDNPNRQYLVNTDAGGFYRLSVLNGVYRVTVTNNMGTIFRPLERIADLRNQDVSDANFVGPISTSSATPAN